MLLRYAYGAALRRTRLQRGMTLRQLSEASSVSLPYLSEIERGRKEASSEILATVCGVLGLSVHDLLRETARELATAGAPVLDLTARREQARRAELRRGELRVDDVGRDEHARADERRAEPSARADSAAALLLAA